MHPASPRPENPHPSLNEMAFLIRRLAVALRRADPGSDLARIAFAHLDRSGFDRGDPMLFPALLGGGAYAQVIPQALGRPLRRDMLVLLWLEDRSLQEVVRQVPEPTLVRALHDPSLARLRDRFLANVTRRHGDRLKDEWSWMKWDTEATLAAQDRVLDSLVRLEAQGTIVIRGYGPAAPEEREPRA